MTISTNCHQGEGWLQSALHKGVLFMPCHVASDTLARVIAHKRKSTFYTYSELRFTEIIFKDSKVERLRAFVTPTVIKGDLVRCWLWARSTGVQRLPERYHRQEYTRSFKLCPRNAVTLLWVVMSGNLTQPPTVCAPRRYGRWWTYTFIWLISISGW